jgi:AcrR family transcriptional regulator
VATRAQVPAPVPTRERILLAAREAFASYGYAAATCRTIAAGCGLAVAALYKHFPSKSELHQAVHEQVKNEVYTRWVNPAVARESTYLGKIDALLDAILTCNATDPSLGAFLFTARVDGMRHAELRPILPRLSADSERLYGDIVDLGVRTGQVAEADRERLEALLQAVNTGLMSLGHDRAAQRLAVEGLRMTLHQISRAQAATPTARRIRSA